MCCSAVACQGLWFAVRRCIALLSKGEERRGEERKKREGREERRGEERRPRHR
jgi:hypothetical protein